MSQRFRRKFVRSATLGFLLWILGFYLLQFHHRTSIEEKDIQIFEAALQEKSSKLEKQLNNFIADIQAEKNLGKQFEIARKRSFLDKTDYFIYENDSLKVWTTNSIPLNPIRDTSIQDGNIVRLQNGWYKIESSEKNNLLYMSVMLIKYEYDFENDELVNNFSPHLLRNFKGDIVTDDSGFPVHNKYGKKIFSITPAETPIKNKKLELIIFFSYLFAFLILIQLLINAFQKLLLKNQWLLIIFPLSILVLRYFWIQSGWLGSFEKFEIFNPELFASESVASFGDLIINVSIFYLIVHFLMKRTRNWFTEGKTKLKVFTFLIPLFILSFFVAHETNHLIMHLVNDSQIKFDLEYLFDLNIYSFISIGLIGTVFYTYFRLIQYIVIQLRKTEIPLNRLSLLWFFVSVIYLLLEIIFSKHSFLISLWPILLSGILLWFHFTEREYKFLHIISILAFVSFYAAFILKGYNDLKEHGIRETLAEIIADDKDESAEFDYAEAERELKKKGFLIPYFKGDFSQKKLNEDLESGPFRRLKNKFDLSFYLFKRDKEMVEDFKNYDVKGYDRFIEIIRQSGERVESESDIFYIRDYQDKLTYIGHFLVHAGDSLHGHLFTEMRSKKFPEDIGLPSLLLENPLKFADQLKHYSVAKYVDDKLVNHRGEFSYPRHASEYFTKNTGYENSDDYNHFIYTSENNHTIVLSKPISRTFALFTSFSYILIIFGVLLLIPFGYRQFERGISFSSIKLNVKIQAVMIGLILITLISFGIGAVTFVEHQYHENNKELIKEKISSVKTEFESKLKDEKQLRTELSDYLEYLLKKFSGVFLTDINLYSTGGELLASSQPKIYSKGILSRKMNPEAFRQIHLLKKNEFVHEEQIGTLNYLSAYTPFFNRKGEMLAYLNVQYISRQGELENQISGFLLAIINIMVLMLALSTILAITFSNRLTRPLKYIQDSLRSVQIGAASKPIEYKGSDEIGELVKEYNKKVEELQMNAEQLAKSERESAWREMAKQVAHEIKNPLTPMKLSIQHLMRSINLADEDSKEKLNKVTKSLIEQIDALTHIANEFSNFAKMPRASENEINLSEVLRSAATVFEESDEYNLELNFDTDKKTMIWADKDLLLRVFNNLIKNATQAVRQQDEFDKLGTVKVNLEESADYYTVIVEDNGSGISDTQKEKIFVPYFTTKSTGTGLGLAMSKQIVENHNGKIWFESVKGKGTIFYVSLPKISSSKK